MCGGGGASSVLIVSSCDFNALVAYSTHACAPQSRSYSCLPFSEHENNSLAPHTHSLHSPNTFWCNEFHDTIVTDQVSLSSFRPFLSHSPLLSPHSPSLPSHHLLSDGQCTSNGSLFAPLVAALSSVVALWLCCTLCLIGGLYKVRRKRQWNRRCHGNQIQQANKPEEGLAEAPRPQEDRPCPSVVTEPLPSR